MSRYSPRILPALLAALAATEIATAQENVSMAASTEFTREQLDFFEKNIRPVLMDRCFKCHSETAEKVKGGLLLDTREAVLRGGDNGHAVVPGSPRESLLYTAITYTDSDMEMPPKTKLPESVIANFEKWIQMGAPDPRREDPDSSPANKPKEKYTNTIDIEAGRDHWAYQKPVKTKLPEVSDPDWPKRDLDRYVLAKLDEAGLKPAPEADPRTLVRRLFFDLIGLPPTPSQVEGFVQAWERDADAALAGAVDKLLDSPRFGERWGRHWLDVARYGESSGKEANALYPHAWRYRDYVIDSLNADKPFDQFVREQIAGDLLPAESDEQRASRLVATGFLAIGTKSLNEQNTRQFRFDLVDEQIDTTTQAILGTTAACARCHDHKFDPIPSSDYYALAGIFLSSETFFGTARNQQNRRATGLVELPVPDAKPPIDPLSVGQLIDLQYALYNQREQLDGIQEQAREARRSGDSDTAQRLQLSTLRFSGQIGLAEARLALYDEDGRPKPLAMAVRDREEPFDSQILIRGEEEKATAERVPRGFLQVIKTGDEEPISADESGRLQLADWMVSPENPLTARVFANRAWYWLTGRGIVTSVDNFGATGQAPSHPELLDHLAIRFMEKNWSIKSLVRELALSRTYRMSSTYDEAGYEKDPDNNLLWRMAPRRLDAESLRDATLAVSGRLDLARPVGSAIAKAGDGFVGRTVNEATVKAASNHRSVYLPIVRDLVPESLDLFDFADPSLVMGSRDVTTVPSQALYLMNSDFVRAQSAAMAVHLTEDMNLSGPKLGYMAFYLAYGRPPTAEEGRKTKAYFERFVDTAKQAGTAESEARDQALVTFCQALLSSAEFRYLN